MRKSIVRLVGSAAAVAVPAVIGMGGMASADTYGGHTQQANPAGASQSHTTSATGDHNNRHDGGGASYGKTWQHAGADGASSSGKHAATGNQARGNGHDGGGASYDKTHQHAGPDGADSSNTHAATGNNAGGDNGGHAGNGGLINIEL